MIAFVIVALAILSLSMVVFTGRAISGARFRRVLKAYAVHDEPARDLPRDPRELVGRGGRPDRTLTAPLPARSARRSRAS